MLKGVSIYRILTRASNASNGLPRWSESCGMRPQRQAQSTSALSTNLRRAASSSVSLWVHCKLGWMPSGPMTSAPVGLSMHVRCVAASSFAECLANGIRTFCFYLRECGQNILCSNGTGVRTEAQNHISAFLSLDYLQACLWWLRVLVGGSVCCPSNQSILQCCLLELAFDLHSLVLKCNTRVSLKLGRNASMGNHGV